MKYSLILVLFIFSTSALICPVCQGITPCPGTDKFLLSCAIANSTSCGQCNTTCTQCGNGGTSIYVCTCPSPYPTRSPTRTPTSHPTVSPTMYPTNVPTDAPTRSPTPPLSPVMQLFTPTPAPVAPTNAPTNTPTNTPTQTPTSSPTNAPTNTPPSFNQCQFCNDRSPPPIIPCNDSARKLLMLCKAYDTTDCIPCPLFCPFCYPVLAPSPRYVCQCPPTNAPTLSPTQSPTNSPTMAPTGAPTEKLPDLISKESMGRIVDVAVSTIIIAFICIVVIIVVIFCCVIPDSLVWPRQRDHEL